MGNIRKLRVEDNFNPSGESIERGQLLTPRILQDDQQGRVPLGVYEKAEKKWFDIYDISKNIVLGFSKGLSAAHTGVLPWYAIWIIGGLLIMMIIFM